VGERRQGFLPPSLVVIYLAELQQRLAVMRVVAVGDFNGDGVPDLAAVDAITATLSVLAGNGDGTFKPAVTYDAGPQAAALTVGDFNGDGRPDVAVGNDTTTNISILLGSPVISDLTITKSHNSDFAQGQAGAAYNIAVRNLGPGPASGTVTVVDTLPAGLTAVTLGGDGWTCSPANLTCTRRDALAAGGAYPAITLTVNVAPDAPASVINTATVSGGGDSNSANNTAADPTNITAGLTITTISPDPARPACPIRSRWRRVAAARPTHGRSCPAPCRTA
jgi:uncharacterized repeat protein (TIGR01451 family)